MRCRSAAAPDSPVRIMRLGYSQGELVQGIGFWYYIFGEGKLEHYVRDSRSPAGAATAGRPAARADRRGLLPGRERPRRCRCSKTFAAALLAALEPILPEDRAEYFIP